MKKANENTLFKKTVWGDPTGTEDCVCNMKVVLGGVEKGFKKKSGMWGLLSFKFYVLTAHDMK